MKTYSSPKLTVFGSVETLTKGAIPGTSEMVLFYSLGTIF